MNTPDTANYEKSFEEFIPTAYRLAHNFVGQEGLTTTLNGIFNEIQGPLTQTEIQERSLRTKFRKPLESYLQKSKKLKEGEELTDENRFTIKLDGEIDKNCIINTMEKAIELAKESGFELYQIRPKYEYSGYSDMTLIFSTEIDGKTVYLEIQINSQVGLDAKEEETFQYAIRKNLVEQILQMNPHLNLSIKDLRKTLNVWLYEKIIAKSNQELELSFFDLLQFVGKNKLFKKQKISLKNLNNMLDLINSYKDSLLISRKIFAKANPIIRSKNSGKDIVDKFKQKKPDLANVEVVY